MFVAQDLDPPNMQNAQHCAKHTGAQTEERIFMSWKGTEVFERGLKDVHEPTGVRGGAKIGQAESLKVLKHQIAQANWGTASTKARARQVANDGNGETDDGSEPSGPSSGFRLYLVGNEKSLKVLNQCHVQICIFKKSC